MNRTQESPNIASNHCAAPISPDSLDLRALTEAIIALNTNISKVMSVFETSSGECVAKLTSHLVESNAILQQILSAQQQQPPLDPVSQTALCSKDSAVSIAMSEEHLRDNLITGAVIDAAEMPDPRARSHASLDSGHEVSYDIDAAGFITAIPPPLLRQSAFFNTSAPLVRQEAFADSVLSPVILGGDVFISEARTLEVGDLSINQDFRTQSSAETTIEGFITELTEDIVPFYVRDMVPQVRGPLDVEIDEVTE